MYDSEVAANPPTKTSKGKRQQLLDHEDRLMVFVSSVMDKRVEDLEAERKCAVATITAIPLTRAWAFEYSPASAQPLTDSYLTNVDRCDIFVMIANSETTDAVLAEWHRATARAKRRLVFLNRHGKPAAPLAHLIDQMDVKYARYEDMPDLREQVRAAIISEIVAGYRSFNLQPADYAALAATIRSTPVSFIVRTIEPRELPQVTGSLPGLQELYPDFASWAAKKRAEIADGKAEGYVARHGDQNVGFALTTNKDEDGKVRKISTLFILPQHQHHGVGPRLLFGLLEKAARDGVEKLYLTVSEERRESLEPLLLHYGFFVEGVSGRRYRQGSWEWIWGKRMIHGTLRRGDLPS